jgi:hypothetical protein
VGVNDGSIIATIITIHIPMNAAVVSNQVSPVIGIHVRDSVQPPSIGVPSIADIDAHQTVVTAVLTPKTSAEMPKKAR